MPFLPPNQQRQSTEGFTTNVVVLMKMSHCGCDLMRHFKPRVHHISVYSLPCIICIVKAECCISTVYQQHKITFEEEEEEEEEDAVVDDNGIQQPASTQRDEQDSCEVSVLYISDKVLSVL